MSYSRFSQHRWRRTATVAGFAVLLAAAGTTPAAAVGAYRATIPAAPAAKPVAGVSALTPDQASVQARATGRSVLATTATSPTSTLTANPDGTLTMTVSAVPVRKLVGGSWVGLDAGLRFNTDGTVSPAVTSGGLTLSGGGGGPLASMSGGGRTLALTLPFTLPKPVLSGATATYRDVLPGADIAVTATSEGGFSEVVVLKNAAAAANPRLAALTFATRSTGVTLSADKAGNIAGRDAFGRIVVSAPAPRIWDSSTAGPASRAVLNPAARTPLGAQTGQAVTSSATGPGERSRVGKLGVALTAGHIRLTPDRAFMSSAALRYPVYVDPAWTALTPAPSFTGWAVVGNGQPTTKYWKDSPSGASDMQTGMAPGLDDVRRTLLNFTIDTTTLSGAAINTAELDIQNNWSDNCTAQKVDIYAPAKDLISSNADWNDWTSGWGTQIDQQTKAFGWSSSCPTANIGFDVKPAVVADVSSGNKTQTFLIKADNETTEATWKRYAASSPAPSMSITYNHTPAAPNGQKTSPVTSCTGSAVGDSDVKLYASIHDADGGTLGETFHLWQTSNTAVTTSSNPASLTAPSDSSSTPYDVPESWFKTAANGAATSFSWQVQVTDTNTTNGTSPWSSICSFIWDPTRTGKPNIGDPAAATIGQQATFTVTKPDSGTVPSAYLYQLNGGTPGNVTADAAGSATIVVTPGRFTNVLTVTSLSAGSNIGDTASETFTAAPAATAADGDLTGDGNADLITVGGTGTVPAGLWLAAGNGTNGVNVNAVDIGANGNGPQGDDSPTDFNGAQVITGHFTGSGLQDLLYYYPGGLNAGSGGVLNGNGDGSQILAPEKSGNQHTLTQPFIDNNYDANGNSDSPLQVVNAGFSSGSGSDYPDIIGINGDTGGTANGYYLDYYPNQGGLSSYGFPAAPLSNLTPSGGTDWVNWTLASAQVSGSTDLYLWNKSTGALYLWSGLAYDINTNTLSFTQTAIKTTGWNTGVSLTLEAADINNDGTPDLWSVGTGGVATANLVTGLGGTPAITAQSAQTINTADHTWALSDPHAGVVGTGAAADTTGAINASGSGNAKWNTGDLFDPDVIFDGSAGTALYTTTRAVTTNADFTVSAWVKPSAGGGTVVSEDGVNTAAFKVWAEPTDKSWRFAMSASDVASPAWTTASAPAGSVQLGVWTQVAVTYKEATGLMILWINGVNVASAERTTSWNPATTGGMRIGDQRTSSTAHGVNFNGQLSGIQTWHTLQYKPAVNNHDFNGDGRNDMITVDTSGIMWLYPNTGATGLVTFGPRIQISSGWSGDRISVADWNQDGLADIICIDGTGNLWLYPNIGGKGTSTIANVTGRTPIGSGWTSYKYGVGNFDNNPQPDHVGVNTTNGLMYAYPEGTNKTQVNTTGWGNNVRLSVIDFNGDGKGDIVAIDNNGDLWFYPNTSTTSLVLGSRVQIGSGWSSYNETAFDVDGDGWPDLIGEDSSGGLWLYPNDHIGHFNARTQIGSGFVISAIG